MPKLRVCSFNVEWMNDWFTQDGQAVAFKNSFTKDGHSYVTSKIANRVAGVIRAIDPDILAIQEGPSRLGELELFIQQYLSQDNVPSYKAWLGDSGGEQKVGLLYKPGSVVQAQLAPHNEVAVLIDPWESDVDGDGFLNQYVYTRSPLAVDFVIGGDKLQVIVLHTKSNFINHGQQIWKNPATHQNYIVAALQNRRRNSSEGKQVRTYVDSVLAQSPKAKIIIVGDLNDGPGMDYFEEKYLTHNVTDILVGSAFQPEWIFAHAQHDVTAADRYTAIFDDFVTGEKKKRLLLDHLLLSPGLAKGPGLHRVPNSGTIHHAEYQAQTSPGTGRDKRPSDHRPVSVQLSY